MGVTGLWKLIEPCGKPVPVETLEGKILAVDISIWLHQVVKGFQDNKGSALNNAHLLGLFHRLCKLLYYRVRPVFIFDGCVPQLKRDTIARRQQQRSKLNNEADRIQALLLQSLAKEKVVQQALGKNAELLLKSPVKSANKNSREDTIDDLFKLPELPAITATADADNESDWNDASFNSYTDEYTSATDSSMDESCARSAYNANIQAIDVRSQHFLNLPADVRHEILTDIKETRKQSSWGRLHELPSRSDDFCSFQMKRLLKRRAVQESLEEAEQEMGGRTLTYAELSNFFNEEGIVTPSVIEQTTKQVSSDEHTRFLLVRDLKKKTAESVDKKDIKCEVIKEEDEADLKTETVDNEVVKKEEDTVINVEKEMGNEYDEDLQLAIALSLEETKVYDEKDYEYDSDQDLKLNREQSKQLKHAAKGPARAYMIEYGGMNVDEVNNIMESTQVGDINDTQYLNQLLNISSPGKTEETHTDIVKSQENATVENSENVNLSQELNLRVSDDSDTDTDLEEVVDTDEVANKTKLSDTQALEIVLNLNTVSSAQDDLFADVFDEPKLNKDILDETKASEEPIEILDSQEEALKTKNKKPLSDKDLVADIDKSKMVERNTEEPIEILDSQEETLKSENEKSSLDKEVVKASQEEKNAEPAESPLISKVKQDNVKMLSILSELKKQTDEIKNIKLDSIKLSEPVIDISDDELVKPDTSKIVEKDIKTEIIEIPDSDEIETGKISRLSSNSPQEKTPTKSTKITEYFETNYFIKRTPDKPKEESSPVPKVKSPFFVNKTPKSARKRESSTTPSPDKKHTKAAKMLFETAATETEDVDAIKEIPAISAEDVLKEAAETLKTQKTDEELQAIANELAKERRDLETERNRQDRMGMSISQRMNAECQELLRLFGIPFIVAPMEAEAQCAFLNYMELTNGTITDDSDIWLFGGRTVYKNFFAQNKHVLEFRADQIEKSFNCDRKKLIQLACLVGSDYTTGVHGIGTVTALEIIASFSSIDKETNQLTNPTAMQNIITTLRKFRDWWQAQKSSAVPGSSARLSLRKKLKNIELHEGFPNIAVIEAYLTPKVDENREDFSWGYPDVESLREFARKTFGWTTSKTDDILMPVIKKLNDKRTQGSIRNYFSVKSALSVRELKVSKRVQVAIDKLSGKIDAETPEKPAKQKRVNKRGKRKAAENVQAEEDPTTTVEHIQPIEAEELPSTSKPRKCARIPNTKEIIPQREKDLETMRQNKAKAAEIMKKTKTFGKKKAKAT